MMKTNTKINLIFTTLFLLIPGVLALFSTAESQKTVEDISSFRVTSVIDGDTIKIAKKGEEFTVRLIGIDTPETNHPSKPVQCFGIEAKEYMKKLLENQTVTLERDISETDRYGRLLRYVYLGDVQINQLLVEEGYAFAKAFPPDIKYQTSFKNAEIMAKEDLKGLWNPETCGGSTQ